MLGEVATAFEVAPRDKIPDSEFPGPLNGSATPMCRVGAPPAGANRFVPPHRLSEGPGFSDHP